MNVKAIKELSEMGPSAVGFEADICFLRAQHAVEEAGPGNLSEVTATIRVKNGSGGREIRQTTCYLRNDTLETLYCSGSGL